MTTIPIYALLTVQGTAMSEAALCGNCLQDEHYVNVAKAAAAYSGGWDEEDFQDCTGNEELICIVCGATERLSVERVFSDAEILDRIAHLLSAEEWPGASGLEDIAELVVLTGRSIADDPDIDWVNH